MLTNVFINNEFRSAGLHEQFGCFQGDADLNRYCLCAEVMPFGNRQAGCSVRSRRMPDDRGTHTLATYILIEGEISLVDAIQKNRQPSSSTQ